MTGRAHESAIEEVERSIDALFTFAAWSDKFDGLVHHTPFRNVTLAMPEPIGVMGILCPDALPLLGFVYPVAAAISMGNAVVVVPSPSHPLSATDLYQVLETSDVPPGAINVVTGDRTALARVLAAHDDVDGVWYFGDGEGCKDVEFLSAGNMKRTWTHTMEEGDCFVTEAADQFLREATQTKNIWVPYGA